MPLDSRAEHRVDGEIIDVHAQLFGLLQAGKRQVQRKVDAL
jgi:hypothetical protein